MPQDDEGSARPDLVRKFCRLVTCDQSQLVSESPVVVVPIVPTGRCSFFEASSARSLNRRCLPVTKLLECLLRGHQWSQGDLGAQAM